MSQLILVLTFLLTLTSFAQAECTNCSSNSDQNGYCDILPPNTYDNNRRFCSGSSFGVTYQGTLVANVCYPSIQLALQALRSIPYCHRSTSNGYCNILEPNTYDQNRRFCSGTSYGVTYGGYLASNNCYSSLELAFQAMDSIRACSQPPSSGSCSILFPNTYDNNRRFCSGVSFGVTYKGYLAADACYSTIDQAMDAMNALNNN